MDGRTIAQTQPRCTELEQPVLILRKLLAASTEHKCSLFLNEYRRQRVEPLGDQLPPNLVQMAAIFGVAITQFLTCLVPILERAYLATRVVRFNIRNVK